MPDHLDHVLDVRAVEALLAGAGAAVRASVLERFAAAGGSLRRWGPHDQAAMLSAARAVEGSLSERCGGRATLRLLARRLEVSTSWISRLAERAGTPPMPATDRRDQRPATTHHGARA